jgi:hypothetical protein
MSQSGLRNWIEKYRGRSCFHSRIGSGSFGTKVARCFWGVDPGLLTRSLNLNLKVKYHSVIAQQSVTKIISVTIMNLVKPKAGAKHELLFNELASDQWNCLISSLRNPVLPKVSLSKSFSDFSFFYLKKWFCQILLFFHTEGGILGLAGPATSNKRIGSLLGTRLPA